MVVTSGNNGQCSSPIAPPFLPFHSTMILHVTLNFRGPPPPMAVNYLSGYKRGQGKVFVCERAQFDDHSR